MIITPARLRDVDVIMSWRRERVSSTFAPPG